MFETYHYSDMMEDPQPTTEQRGADVPEQATELEFLRWFYGAAGEVFGPADSDVYQLLKEDFTRETGLTLPEDYK